MKFASVLALLAGPFVVSAIHVSYDTVYDNGGLSLNGVACSDGPNGLESKGPYNTLGDLPTFPNVTGADVVAGWGSPNCGTCWTITYNNQSVTVTVVDHAGDGFNLSEEAMNFLTNNQAEFLGTVDATAVQVDASNCGL